MIEIVELKIEDYPVGETGEIFSCAKVRVVANGRDNIHEHNSMPFIYTKLEDRDSIIAEAVLDLVAYLRMFEFTSAEIQMEIDKILPSITNYA